MNTPGISNDAPFYGSNLHSSNWNIQYNSQFETKYFCGPGHSRHHVELPSIIWNPNHHKDAIQDIIVSPVDNKLYIVMKRNKIYKLNSTGISEITGFTSSTYRSFRFNSILQTEFTCNYI